MSRTRWARRPDVVVFVAMAVLIGSLTLVPLAYVGWQTFAGGHPLGLSSIREAYTAYRLNDLLWNSLRFGLGSTVLAVVLGTGLAYLLVRTDVPAKPLLFAGVLVPLIVPGVLYTISWIFLAAPRSGALNVLLEPLAGPGTFDVFSIWGMIVVEGLHLAPIAFLLMAAAFRSMDPALEESAMSSGAPTRTVFRRVTLPLVRPALSATILLVAIRAFEAFEVPALLGLPDGIWVFTSRIWRALGQYPPALGVAGAYALPLLAITSLGLALHLLLSRRTASYATLTGRGFRPRPMPLGTWRGAATAGIVAYVVVAAVLPVLVLFYVSVQRFYGGVSIDGLTHATGRAYTRLLHDEQVVRSLRNSLLLGVGVATAVMVSMAVASWLVVRTKLRGRGLIDQLAFLPVAIPGVVLGLALLVVYVRVPVPIYGTLWILAIAYFTGAMPYGMRTVSISMLQIGRELEESAHSSGAGWWSTFRRILLPLLVPGLAAGWIYVLLVTLRDLSSAILLYAPGTEVVPVTLWERFENGQFPEVAALGIVTVVLTLILTGVALGLSRRIGVRGA